MRVRISDISTQRNLMVRVRTARESDKNVRVCALPATTTAVT